MKRSKKNRPRRSRFNETTHCLSYTALIQDPCIRAYMFYLCEHANTIYGAVSLSKKINSFYIAHRSGQFLPCPICVTDRQRYSFQLDFLHVMTSACCHQRLPRDKFASLCRIEKRPRDDLISLIKIISFSCETDYTYCEFV